MSAFLGTAKPSNGHKAPERPKPWVEKYRPKNLDDVSAQDHTVTILKRTLQSNNLPHMLFYGPPGTGKTSTILALAKQLYGPELIKSRVLELNASDERGISIVREKVKDFAKRVISNPSDEDLANYPCPPYKLVILDEADSMTSDAQSALRRTMENYSKITRFCLICNYVTRIIDPLASRCSKFRFKSLEQHNALERLQYIADQEQVKYEPGSLEKLLYCSAGDLRKAITLLQSGSKLAKPIAADGDGDVEMSGEGSGSLTVDIVNEVSGTVPEDVIDELLTACKSNQPLQIRKAVDNAVAEGWSGSQIVLQVHSKLIQEDDSLRSTQKSKISWYLSEADLRLVDGVSEHLELLNMLCKISSVVS